MTTAGEDEIRATEHERLRALVAQDMDVARRLHADDFQLVPPGGHPISKAEYLADVASGAVHYLVFEPISPIEVRLYGDAAAIRYQSHIDIIVGGEHLEPNLYWHTDTYECRDGRWQAVWSQATRIS
jgi:Domain of unknown function (DUF4440)